MSYKSPTLSHSSEPKFKHPQSRPTLVLLAIIAYFAGLLLALIYGQNHNGTAWTAAGLMVAFCGGLYKLAPRAFVLLFLFIVGQTAAVLSCAYIEGGSYIVEQATFGFSSGATIRLVLYNSIFFLFASWWLHQSLPQVGDGMHISRPVARFIGLSYSGVLVVVAIGLAITGVPLFMGLDRFSFNYDHPFPLLLTLAGQLYAGALVLGILHVGGYRIMAMCLFWVTVMLFVLQSEKFSGLIMLGFMYVLPIAVHRMNNGRWRPSIRSLFIAALPIFAFFVVIIGYHYASINAAVNTSVVEALTNRALGLQGHVWWGIDTDLPSDYLTGDSRLAMTELDAIMKLPVAVEQVGMRYLMEKVAPARLAQAYIDRGVNFTMGYPAIGLAVFGYIGLLPIQVLAASFVCLAMVYLYRKVRAGQALRALLAAKIAIEVYAAFTMGNLFGLTSAKMILYVGLALCCEAIVRLARQRGHFANFASSVVTR